MVASKSDKRDDLDAVTVAPHRLSKMGVDEGPIHSRQGPKVDLGLRLVGNHVGFDTPARRVLGLTVRWVAE